MNRAPLGSNAAMARSDGLFAALDLGTRSTARRALLFDIGGGSTELARVRLDRPRRTPELIGTANLPINVVSPAERHRSVGLPKPAYQETVAEITRCLEPFEQTHRFAQEVRQGGVQRLGTSGTVTTLAGIASAWTTIAAHWGTAPPCPPRPPGTP